MNSIVTRNSSWDEKQIEGYFHSAHTPIRIAVSSEDGYPIICSMWFEYSDGYLWCAAHQSSRLIQALQANAKCSFEISGNEVPYCGVRGRGTVTLDAQSAKPVLESLIKRYLGNSNSSLSNWLLGRAAEEYAIRIELTRLSAWDFSHRMSPVSTT
ncbi:MAG: pyridoxamine 5'-phosphate oxidase family protein [Pseudomonadales bacterium]